MYVHNSNLNISGNTVKFQITDEELGENQNGDVAPPILHDKNNI